MYSELVFDHTWTGFLTAVFDMYAHKLSHLPLVRQSHYQPGMFGTAYTVHTDDSKAGRVWAVLCKKLSAAAQKELYSCHLSELSGIEDTMSRYVQLMLGSDAQMEYAYANSAVMKVTDTARMVHRETHRMEAFIRFRLTADGIYYAVIEPDFNVIPLLAKHFRDRYADQRWLIYDLKRRYGIYYDLERVEEVEFTESPGEKDRVVFADNEQLYQELWQGYFKSANIRERKNTKLHLRHVPKRYWKYLTEKVPA